MRGDSHALIATAVLFRFNPRLSHERRPGMPQIIHGVDHVSIHASRMRGDGAIVPLHHNSGVSIHASRMRGDVSSAKVVK